MAQEYTDFQLAYRVAQEVHKAGGRTFFVGGYVRDQLLNIPNKDIDIEIHGITPDALQLILTQFGHLDERKVGESFGIFALRGYDLDIALPRKEISTGEGGHKDFIIDIDPFLWL
ncbi:hypothetical protein [Butyrivibrio sp.]|uniref:hypothetical protein n=1 Tax=Butyrivibrio sp. TaxID=28121 RepID=UPI0025C2FDD5|nr:hypothetical protein [Butyrivibrio sp.]MBQ7431273.1 hypothetical protein [Butyrivibrio sp.]MBQ9303488.1 hypothetical protein [Butyrivibrio sp.]